MKLKYLTLITFFSMFLFINAQEIGYSFSIDGQEMDQMINHEHAEIYDLSSSVNVNYEGANGYAFDVKGNKIEFNDMRLSYQNVKYMDTESNFLKKIDLNLFKKFIIAGDTLITVADTLLNNKKKFKKFVTIGKVDETKKYELYKLELKNKTKYYLKNKQTKVWKYINYKFNKDFQDEIVSLFTYIPYIKLKKTNFNYNDIKSLVKTVRYYENYKAGNNLYFNSCMSTVTDKSQMSYYSKIDNIKDSIWDLSFYNKQGVKTFKGQYSSIDPLTKQGKMEWYYPDGKIRKKAKFINDDLKDYYTSFNHDGSKHNTFKITKKGKIKVLSIFNDKEEEQKENIKTHTYYDYVNERNLDIEYENNKLDKVSYLDKDSNIRYFLLTDTPSSYKTKIALEFPEEELKSGIEGMIRIKILLDNNGEILTYKVLPSVDTQFTKPTIDFILNSKHVKFKPAKNENKKVNSEFIYSIAYKIHKTINRSSNMMFHQMMFQQQMMMQQMQMSRPTGF